MDNEQQSEWDAAQNISVSVDLISAAKRQLQFLAAVDRNRWLYEGQSLKWAIYRYNMCWLPLLAKHCEYQVTEEGPLVVPLDCEWVWHCHRLNPVRYKSDCEEFYGRILDNCNVVSCTTQGISSRETEEIWNKLYPKESYHFDMTRGESTETALDGTKRFSTYDFTLAVERQSPFFYQVSRAHFNSDVFLESAVARYKGFLHIIRRNRERSVKRFCVPTYDIDLIWHTHQLHPASYGKDLVDLLGKILEHDDTDQNRGKGQKLDTGFTETTKQWEETFGSRYWRAGVMYRGTAPSPVTTVPCLPPMQDIKAADSTNNRFERLFYSPALTYIEVLLEFVEIKNLPEMHKGKVSVMFRKSKPDGILNVKRKLSIQSECNQKQVAMFQCQPIGYLYFELVSHQSDSDVSTEEQVLGSCYISMEEEFTGSDCTLSVEKWLDVVPISGGTITTTSEPIRLRVAASCTLPVRIPHVVQMLTSSPLAKKSCVFPFFGMVSFSKSWTRISDAGRDEIFRIQMRKVKKNKGIADKSLTKEIIGLTEAGETLVFGQLIGHDWSLLDSLWSLKLQNSKHKDSDLLLTGPRMVKLVSGRKLDYEPKQHQDKQTNESNFITAVEFSGDHPYGKAVGLFDLKSGVLTLQEAWFTLPGILSAFIASKHFQKGRI